MRNITKVKIICKNAYLEFENEINDFAEKNNVIATQTHVLNKANILIYVAVIYYRTNYTLTEVL